MDILYYDCFSGISGDMALAALIDAGCPEDYLRAELAKVDIGSFDLIISRDKRGGIEGTRVEVRVKKEPPFHRNLQHITTLIEQSRLRSEVKDLALKIFQILAEGEAKVHGTTVHEVHFHEIGAVDSLVDIIGAAVAIDFFRPRLVLSSSVELGSGIITCTHGTFPVPAPATAEILKGMPVRMGGQPFEATTPTGASILAATVHRFTENIALVPQLIGYGLGQREGRIPNVLRIILGEEIRADKTSDTEISDALLIETNIDDMTPEETGHLLEILLAKGAQDVYLTPIIMKKTRPAVKISVLCDEALRDEMVETIFLHSSTFGLRYWHLTKAALRRENDRLETPYGDISVKKGFYGGRIIKIKPEFEDCRKIAENQGISVKRVLESVNRHEQG